jgi:hypothetical protein
MAKKSIAETRLARFLEEPVGDGNRLVALPDAPGDERSACKKHRKRVVKAMTELLTKLSK